MVTYKAVYDLEAVFENGAFRPVQPVMNFKEGEKVSIRLEREVARGEMAPFLYCTNEQWAQAMQAIRKGQPFHHILPTDSDGEDDSDLAFDEEAEMKKLRNSPNAHLLDRQEPPPDPEIVPPNMTIEEWNRKVKEAKSYREWMMLANNCPEPDQPNYDVIKAMNKTRRESGMRLLFGEEAS